MLLLLSSSSSPCSAGFAQTMAVTEMLIFHTSIGVNGGGLEVVGFRLLEMHIAFIHEHLCADCANLQSVKSAEMLL